MTDSKRFPRIGVGAVALFLGVALAVALGRTLLGGIVALAGAFLLLTAATHRRPLAALLAGR